MAALTAAGAFMRVPLPYVPITLQLTCVCLAGIWLGSRLGAASQGVYLATGLLGFPIFAHGGGPHYLLEPTIGYLLAFPAAAALMGTACGRRVSLGRALITTLGAVLLVYAAGVAGLYANLRFIVGRELDLANAAKLGLAPLPKDLLITLPACVAATRSRAGQGWLRRCSDT
jgi:biotin transport system substrate-specific component